MQPLLSKPREQLQQQKWPQNSQQQLLQQMHMQLVLQKHIEQQQLQRQCQGQLVEAQLQHGTASNALAEQKLGMSYATAQKMFDEALNPQNQDDVLSEAQMKVILQVFGKYCHYYSIYLLDILPLYCCRGICCHRTVARLACFPMQCIPQ